ncbi:MAG: PH domain-containing protein [Saprospiraceae bacterium]|jgi:membrane protein YdbS with pleckstrin-like domain|nr:PH domain-containing protein [Saprospiraceae bacterium]
MQFQNPQLASETMPSIEHISYEKLDPAYKKVNVYITLFFCLIILLVYLGVEFAVPELYQFPWILLFSVLWSVLTGLFCVLAIKSYDYEGYAIREKDILYKSGIFFRSVLVIPFNRVQHCETEQGPIERWFGLTQLSLFTAGGSGSDLSIPGLTQEKANALKNFITQKVAKSDDEEK